MEESNTHHSKKWYHYFLNKYLLVGGFFLVWMIFFDVNSYLRHQDLDQDIEKLESEKDYYQSQIDTEKSELKALQTDQEKVREIAREKYMMKKDNEDIFVIVEENKASEDE